LKNPEKSAKEVILESEIDRVVQKRDKKSSYSKNFSIFFRKIKMHKKR
jgi:hypothetical protein